MLLTEPETLSVKSKERQTRKAQRALAAARKKIKQAEDDLTDWQEELMMTQAHVEAGFQVVAKRKRDHAQGLDVELGGEGWSVWAGESVWTGRG